jgi:hypothetical protein
MKKRIWLLILGIGITAIPAFAFEPGDLLTYPSAVPAGSITVNAGIGFNAPGYGSMTIPPLSGSIDYALPIGGLPFSIGGVFGIYGSANKTEFFGYSYTNSWSYMSFGGRIAYHFNWGIDKFDTYAVTTLGWTIISTKIEFGGEWGNIAKPAKSEATGGILVGASLGARYFFTRNIGAYLELGYSSLSFASTGLSFTF